MEWQPILRRLSIALRRRYRSLLSGLRWKIVHFQVFINGGELNVDSRPDCSSRVRCDGAGTLFIESNVTLGYIKAPRIGNGEILLQARSSVSKIRIGSGTAISNNTAIVSNNSINIGKNCLVGDLVSIFDSDFHAIDVRERAHSRGEISEVSIGDGVWLGSRVMVMKGVSIGANSVVAAGSLVTSDIPENVVAGGVPAKVLKDI